MTPIALVLRALGLGDFLTGLPAIRLLRQVLPEHEIVLAAPAGFSTIVALSPDIDTLFPVGELEPLDGFGRQIDLGIDLHGNGPASRDLISAVRPRHLLGFATPSGAPSGPMWQDEEHEVGRWCRLVDEGLGRPRAQVPLMTETLNRPEASMPSGCTVLHPGAAAGSRRWPAERFVQVARVLRGSGHQVVVTGGRAEADLASAVADAAGVAPMTDLSLIELFDLVAQARLVVCGDTGVAHVASTYGTPSVVLFGPVSPSRWGPPTNARHRVIWHGDGTGDPHGAEVDPALLAITVSEVLAAADEVDTVAHRTEPSRFVPR